MRLATIRTGSGTRAVRIDADTAVECGAVDVGALLATDDWRTTAAMATGVEHAFAGLDYAPVVPRPSKIICVGLNYRSHITEMGRPLPAYPTLFAKYPEALIGPYDTLTLPAESHEIDWEAELAVVIGRAVRRVDRTGAEAAIGGCTVIHTATRGDRRFLTREG